MSNPDVIRRVVPLNSRRKYPNDLSGARIRSIPATADVNKRDADINGKVDIQDGVNLQIVIFEVHRIDSAC